MRVRPVGSALLELGMLLLTRIYCFDCRVGLVFATKRPKKGRCFLPSHLCNAVNEGLQDVNAGYQWSGPGLVLCLYTV